MQEMIIYASNRKVVVTKVRKMQSDIL